MLSPLNMMRYGSFPCQMYVPVKCICVWFLGVPLTAILGPQPGGELSSCSWWLHWSHVRSACNSPEPCYQMGEWLVSVAGFSWTCPHDVSACVLLVNTLRGRTFACACPSLGSLKYQLNSPLFPPQITAISTSRWPETGVVATLSQLRALPTCGQEPVPATESEGAVYASRWRWVGATEGLGTKSRSIFWDEPFISYFAQSHDCERDWA